MASNQAMRIEVVSIRGDHVVINIRLRGENNWLYYDDITIKTGDSIAVMDGGYGEDAGPGFCSFTKIPRSETVDQMIETYD